MHSKAPCFPQDFCEVVGLRTFLHLNLNVAIVMYSIKDLPHLIDKFIKLFYNSTQADASQENKL